MEAMIAGRRRSGDDGLRFPLRCVASTGHAANSLPAVAQQAARHCPVAARTHRCGVIESDRQRRTAIACGWTLFDEAVPEGVVDLNSNSALLLCHCQ